MLSGALRGVLLPFEARRKAVRIPWATKSQSEAFSVQKSVSVTRFSNHLSSHSPGFVFPCSQDSGKTLSPYFHHKHWTEQCRRAEFHGRCACCIGSEWCGENRSNVWKQWRCSIPHSTIPGVQRCASIGNRSARGYLNAIGSGSPRRGGCHLCKTSTWGVSAQSRFGARQANCCDKRNACKAAWQHRSSTCRRTCRTGSQDYGHGGRTLIRYEQRHAGCPIHAASSHEWGHRAKREPPSLDFTSAFIVSACLALQVRGCFMPVLPTPKPPQESPRRIRSAMRPRVKSLLLLKHHAIQQSR